jgi:hypothetical protein
MALLREFDEHWETPGFQGESPGLIELESDPGAGKLRLELNEPQLREKVHGTPSSSASGSPLWMRLSLCC